LRGLIGVGVGAHRDGARRIGFCRQFLRQQFRRVRLHQNLRFEICARRKAQIGMCRPCETIDAAMLAAAIGIDRTVERNVWRGVACDDRARRIADQLGLERRKFFFLVVPPVIEQHALFAVIPARCIRNRTAPMTPPRIGGDVENRLHWESITDDKNKSRTKMSRAYPPAKALARMSSSPSSTARPAISPARTT